ncbi:RmlC-like cupin domain-containing protein [Daldinia caldariorum]|uniref:RmlC-like cupin domain-containing protein n=1 Tax=Daldinia caldariorum TaxID=326644 RepID=UPI002008D2D5|nr:RmlC-like cupin domain-containing protein [Daldinia caldariorum]KAI1465925.1 RmlC-like cupin domain-containing protein [Daldinia caldariorum]
MSSIELQRSFPAGLPSAEIEPLSTKAIIKALSLEPHIEGGYFVETDRDPLLIPSPFPPTPASSLVPQRPGFDPAHRNASTTIFYYLTPQSPQGNFHRNRGRTVHTLHRGRGVYVLIHADEPDLPGGGGGKRIETFIVGPDVANGEKLQWIVEGGKYKASFLLPDDASASAGGDGDGEDKEKEKTSGGLLISETVVPGFEFCDHDFLRAEEFRRLVTPEKAEELAWLVRKA